MHNEYHSRRREIAWCAPLRLAPTLSILVSFSLCYSFFLFGVWLNHTSTVRVPSGVSVSPFIRHPPRVAERSQWVGDNNHNLRQQTNKSWEENIEGDVKKAVFPQNGDQGKVHSGNEWFYGFIIRDARRLSSTLVPTGMHVFDYVDVYAERQQESKLLHLYHDGFLIGNPPCDAYSIPCYRAKMIQVFRYVLDWTNATHMFYMEADNDLCVPIGDIRDLAERYKDRYFIGTGIGASGWIMSREFVLDFLDRYLMSDTQKEKRPDVVASLMLIGKKRWSVTRQYLVSHTIANTQGSDALTVGKGKKTKHLPRCLEPHRGKWRVGGIGDNKDEDKFGWDYFDYSDNKCKKDSEIYPCP